jgi:hypothetical protein
VVSDSRDNAAEELGPILPMRPSQVIAELTDPFIEALLEPHFSDIDTVASFLGIDEGYLSVQVRLLLPQYSDEELHAIGGLQVVREVLGTLRSELQGFESHYKRHRKLNRIDDLPLDLRLKGRQSNLRLVAPSGEEASAILFIEVDPVYGNEIQNEIHYIHQARKDTSHHFGLALKDLEFPLCYGAISPCDRLYQRNALSQWIGQNVELNEIAVLTRAYGYSPLPKNMMSKLFDLTAKRLAETTGYKYLITALNPFLGFKGSIFLGASFVPFARSPLRYRYTGDGLYANRRRGEAEKDQGYATPPIVWLSRPVGEIPDTQWSGEIVDISSEMYENG